MDVPDILTSALDSTKTFLYLIGQQLARVTGMLRITLPTGDGAGIFVLEGKLAGLWAQELLRVARGPNRANGNIFDLQEVFYVDSNGEEALRILSRFGASFITESAYGKDLCKRLKLHRLSASDALNGRQKPEGFLCSGTGQTAET